MSCRPPIQSGLRMRLYLRSIRSATCVPSLGFTQYGFPASDRRRGSPMISASATTPRRARLSLACQIIARSPDRIALPLVVHVSVGRSATASRMRYRRGSATKAQYRRDSLAAFLMWRTGLPVPRSITSRPARPYATARLRVRQARYSSLCLPPTRTPPATSGTRCHSHHHSISLRPKW